MIGSVVVAALDIGRIAESSIINILSNVAVEKTLTDELSGCVIRVVGWISAYEIVRSVSGRYIEIIVVCKAELDN